MRLPTIIAIVVINVAIDVAVWFGVRREMRRLLRAELTLVAARAARRLPAATRLPATGRKLFTETDER